MEEIVELFEKQIEMFYTMSEKDFNKSEEIKNIDLKINELLKTL